MISPIQLLPTIGVSSPTNSSAQPLVNANCSTSGSSVRAPRQLPVVDPGVEVVDILTWFGGGDADGGRGLGEVVGDGDVLWVGAACSAVSVLRGSDSVSLWAT